MALERLQDRLARLFPSGQLVSGPFAGYARFWRINCGTHASDRLSSTDWTAHDSAATVCEGQGRLTRASATAGGSQPLID